MPISEQHANAGRRRRGAWSAGCRSIWSACCRRPRESSAFLADQALRKRDELARELLADDVAYAEHWLTFWNDLLRNDYAGTGFITGGRKQITAWLYRVARREQAVRSVRPRADRPTAGVRRLHPRHPLARRGQRQPDAGGPIRQNISQVFLGINMKCASCHDSFIDRWKLERSLWPGAIYADEPLEIHRCDKPTGRTAQAGWLFPELGRSTPTAPQPERLSSSPHS